jgi:RND superfamily putative drug exporter
MGSLEAIEIALVRMLLMPAFMRVLGRVNWWAPAPLARLHQRFGISDAARGRPRRVNRPRRCRGRIGG